MELVRQEAQQTIKNLEAEVKKLEVGLRRGLWAEGHGAMGRGEQGSKKEGGGA
jgi:hypothetical protein